MPEGAIGVELKLSYPNKHAYEEIFRLASAAHSKLSVVFACGINLSHSETGKFGSKNESLSLKWLLNVWIAFSSAFVQWQ